MSDRIGLHDADGTKYPNLALMKLSAWHKSQGHDVELYREGEGYDQIYSSKVFTFTPDPTGLPEGTIKGGTGYGSKEVLPEEVEHICPDYSLYDLNYSLGFVTRGCIKKCAHCFVPEKEGYIKAHADIKEFVRHKSLVLMDNNILACDHGLSQIEKIAENGIKVDFNQGLDAALVTSDVAALLKRVKFLQPLRLACDGPHSIEPVRKAVELLRYHNVTPGRYFAYLLVKDVDEALERVKFLKSMWVDPFAQPYRDKEGTPPTDEQKAFARWVNMKAEFKTQTWEQYKARKLKGGEEISCQSP